jgi:hypothetical protein
MMRVTDAKMCCLPAPLVPGGRGLKRALVQSTPPDPPSRPMVSGRNLCADSWIFMTKKELSDFTFLLNSVRGGRAVYFDCNLPATLLSLADDGC